MLNVYFWNKKEKMKMQKQWFKRRTWLEEQVLLYFMWTGNARILNMSESQCGQIRLDMYNFVSVPKYAWSVTCLNKPDSKYVWICSDKVQNMHELLLSSFSNWLNIPAVLNMPEYTWICLCQNSDYAWISQNIPEWGKICLTMSNVVNMADYAWNITCVNKPWF